MSMNMDKSRLITRREFLGLAKNTFIALIGGFAGGSVATLAHQLLLEQGQAEQGGGTETEVDAENFKVEGSWQQALAWILAVRTLPTEMLSYLPIDDVRRSQTLFFDFAAHSWDTVLTDPPRFFTSIDMLVENLSRRQRAIDEALLSKGVTVLQMESRIDPTDVINGLRTQQQAAKDDKDKFPRDVQGVDVSVDKVTTMSLLYTLPPQEGMPNGLQAGTEFWTSFQIDGFKDDRLETAIVPRQSIYHGFFIPAVTQGESSIHSNDEGGFFTHAIPQGELFIHSNGEDCERVRPACVNQEWMPDDDLFSGQTDCLGFLITSPQDEGHIKITFVPRRSYKSDKRQITVVESTRGGGYTAKVSSIDSAEDGSIDEEIIGEYKPVTRVIPVSQLQESFS